MAEYTHIKPRRGGGQKPKVILNKFNSFIENVQTYLTAVQLVFNPFSQLVPQLKLYSQLQLSLWSDPIAFSVPKPT